LPSALKTPRRYVSDATRIRSGGGIKAGRGGRKSYTKRPISGEHVYKKAICVLLHKESIRGGVRGGG